MKKILAASVSGIALLGLAACSDTDGTTTQSIDEQPIVMPSDPAAVPTENPATPPPADPAPMD